MPEGIVPELLMVLGFVVFIGGVTFLARRSKDAEDEQATPVTESESQTTTLTASPPETAETEKPVSAEPEPTPVAPPADTPTVERVRPTLRERLVKSRRALAGRLAEALGRGVDDETWHDVEAALIQADIGVEAATRLVEEVKSQARQAKITDPDGIRELLAEELLAQFDADAERALSFAPDGLTVWMVVGVNGTGKTTTIGKLATDLRMHGNNVALAAADTFRAAADEQLGVWAERAGAELVKHQPGADPGAVAFDAVQHSRARKTDVLIVDTAGRLHTKTPLMDELGKIRRVIEKESHVQESLLIIDATAGQNGLVQAKEFASATGVTGVVLTKLDGTAKGGIAVAIEDELGIPIKLIGVGEGIEDLEPFDPKSYVDALLS
jgi:fused signal recognition particle receptor